LAVDPNASLLMFTLLAVPKSRIIPSSRQMPTWPKNGTSHAITGRGVHTRQYGNLAFFTSTSGSSGIVIFVT
jgi:hypothetical protein